MPENKDNFANAMVGIAAIVSVFIFTMFFFGAIFLSDTPASLWVLAPIAVALALMGIALGYFASKRK